MIQDIPDGVLVRREDEALRSLESLELSDAGVIRWTLLETRPRQTLNDGAVVVV